jgi:signal peptidase I
MAFYQLFLCRAGMTGSDSRHSSSAQHLFKTGGAGWVDPCGPSVPHGTPRAGRADLERRTEMSLWSLMMACPLAAAMFALVVMRRCFIVAKVIGTSMTPALMPGDRVLVRRGARSGLRVGLIVVFGQPPDECLVWAGDGPSAPIQWTIKRVAAVHGDAVPEAARPAVRGTAVVPPGMLVLLGDSADSRDSRTWGFVPAADVLGVAVRRLGPSGGRPEL